MSAATSPALIGAILLAALALGTMRLWLRRRGTPPPGRPSPSRIGALVVLQTVAAALLFVAFHPPKAVVRGGTLVVLTANARTPIATDGDAMVALPEAGAIPGAERAPDLATALRRHPDVGRIQVVGDGLVARDRISVPVPLDIRPAPARPGFADVTPPRPVAPGEAFAVGGSVRAGTGGAVELVDPSGAVVARAPVTGQQRFVLSGLAKSAGLVVFELRLRDAAGRVIGRSDVPVEVRAAPEVRILVLAGAPGPEVNFLRRWAETAGVDVAVDIALGGEARLTAPEAALTAEALRGLNLLVVDDRRWEALDAARRDAIGRAVDEGLGLLVKPTGMLSGATQRDWALLGAPLPEDGGRVDVALTPEGPNLWRRQMAGENSGAVTLLRAPDGAALASWRPRGRGRVGVWALADSYVLTLAGQADRHADLWARVVTAVARPAPQAMPEQRGSVRQGERGVVCGLSDGSRLTAQVAPTQLLVDPAAGPDGCAAVWPVEPGWSEIRTPAGAAAAIYTHAVQPLPSPAQSAAPPPADAAGLRESLPWLLGLLIVLSALWVLERRRPRPPTDRATI